MLDAVVLAVLPAFLPWSPAADPNPGGDEPGSAPLATAAEPAPAAPPADNELNWYWKNGLRFESADKAYRFQFGGRIQFDAGWFSGDELEDAGLDLSDGSEFRRARLFVSGELPDGYFFKAEYDFAGSISDTDNRPAFNDVFLGKKDVFSSVDVTAGHFKEPFGLEQLTSSRFITFMERSVSDALVPSRNDGVMFSDTYGDDQLGTWALGGFRANTDNAGFSSDNGGYALTARATAAPVYAEEGAQVVHVGAAYSMRDADDARFRSRPEAHLLPNFIDTGTLANDDVDLVGLELAGVWGPFSAQAEYVMASADNGVDADFAGYYVEASWFLTGEHRNYDRSKGAFSRVSPLAYGAEGNGAWQVAARFSSLDLDDGGVMGGQLDDITLGLNWYINPNTRVYFNYILANVDDESVPVDDDANIFMIRLQLDW